VGLSIEAGIGEVDMAKDSFDRPFVIRSKAAAKRFIEASRHPAPPLTVEEEEMIRDMTERGERYLEEMSSRLKRQ
jgi:hypothetical protein